MRAPRILTCVHTLVRARDRLSDLLGHGRFVGSAGEARQESSGVVGAALHEKALRSASNSWLPSLHNTGEVLFAPRAVESHGLGVSR